MPTPTVVTISHRLGRAEAKQRLARGIERASEHLGPYADVAEYRWQDDRLDVRVVAAGQTVAGRVHVFEDHVRVEIDFPWMLAMAAKRIGRRVERIGGTLLGRPGGTLTPDGRR